MRHLSRAATFLALLALCVPAVAGEPDPAPRHRVLIELFTSQG